MGSYQVALGTPIGLDARFHFSSNPPERYRTSVLCRPPLRPLALKGVVASGDTSPKKGSRV